MRQGGLTYDERSLLAVAISYAERENHLTCEVTTRYLSVELLRTNMTSQNNYNIEARKEGDGSGNNYNIEARLKLDGSVNRIRCLLCFYFLSFTACLAESVERGLRRRMPLALTSSIRRVKNSPCLPIKDIYKIISPPRWGSETQEYLLSFEAYCYHVLLSQGASRSF